MEDNELIEFMWKIIYDELSDGDMPSDKDIHTLVIELYRRDILDEPEFPC